MKINCIVALATPTQFFTEWFTKALSFLFLIFSVFFTNAQAVTEVITDFNGYWKSGASAINPVKPDNGHNLLAFSYNGTRYSTGINDGLLASNGETFSAEDFWSLPVTGYTGIITSNTKVGFGAQQDGVTNGANTSAPQWGIEMYLTDGIKGLGLGTCVANLPAGNMTFSIQTIKAAAIGDGIPDIIVTQVADPSGAYDRYEFTDVNGVRVGNFRDIVFTSLPSIGNWTADFYDASHNPLTLGTGFSQTDRTIRLWAADFSEFGITAANLSEVRNFKINLCGNSDLAFVAYNSKSIDFKQILPVQYTFFTASKTNNHVVLNWQTVSEQRADRFVIERSNDGILFQRLDSVRAKNGVLVNNYSYPDRTTWKGKVFYRLRQVDLNGKFTYTKIVTITGDGLVNTALQLFPNPASNYVVIQHPLALESGSLIIYNAAGSKVKQLYIVKNTAQSQIDVSRLPAGNYFISYQTPTKQFLGRLMIEKR